MSDDKTPQTGGVDDQTAIDDQATTESESVVEKEEQQALVDYSHQETDGRLSMNVTVHSPFRDYYNGRAFSISAVNATGPFDILPKHHNFISLLEPCDLVIRTVKKGDQKITISGGIMHVKADEIIVFLDV
jgi:hypothetical protein